MCRSIYRRLTSKFTSARSHRFLPGSLENSPISSSREGLAWKPRTAKTLHNVCRVLGLERKMGHGDSVDSWQLRRGTGGIRDHGESRTGAGDGGSCSALAPAGKAPSIEPLFRPRAPVRVPTPPLPGVPAGAGPGPARSLVRGCVRPHPQSTRQQEREKFSGNPSELNRSCARCLTARSAL